MGRSSCGTQNTNIKSTKKRIIISRNLGLENTNDKKKEADHYQPTLNISNIKIIFLIQSTQQCKDYHQPNQPENKFALLLEKN